MHLYQNYGTGGTGEGLSDLVRARTGYYPKSRFRKGEGTWRDAYTASGNFYSWLTGPCSYHSTFHPKNDLDLPKALQQIKGRGCELETMTTSYFLSRDTVIPTIGGGMAPWREKLFAQMHHNASAAADFLNLPNNSVVELGSKIEI